MAFTFFLCYERREKKAKFTSSWSFSRQLCLPLSHSALCSHFTLISFSLSRALLYMHSLAASCIYNESSARSRQLQRKIKTHFGGSSANENKLQPRKREREMCFSSFDVMKTVGKRKKNSAESSAQPSFRGQLILLR